jgi:hypothetical protein
MGRSSLNSSHSECKEGIRKASPASLKIFKRATEAEVTAAIRAAGLPDGFPEALEALRVWRENRA